MYAVCCKTESAHTNPSMQLWERICIFGGFSNIWRGHHRHSQFWTGSELIDISGCRVVCFLSSVSSGISFIYSSNADRCFQQFCSLSKGAGQVLTKVLLLKQWAISIIYLSDNPRKVGILSLTWFKQCCLLYMFKNETDCLFRGTQLLPPTPFSWIDVDSTFSLRPLLALTVEKSRAVCRHGSVSGRVSHFAPSAGVIHPTV